MHKGLRFVERSSNSSAVSILSATLLRMFVGSLLPIYLLLVLYVTLCFFMYDNNNIIIIMGLKSVSASEDVIGDVPSPGATINSL